MKLRLIGKSIVLGMRSRGRFIVFTLMYSVLMAWMAWNWHDFIYTQARDQLNWLLLGVSIVSTISLSILYAWIVINYRKREIATLKCIGYTNADIRILIIGELLWVTCVAFTLIAEVLIHITSAATYFYSQPANYNAATYYESTKPILYIIPISITLGMFILSQVIGIFVMYHKILKLRPIVALRILK